jgi:pilus assembly protein Flp/PilA
MLNNLTFAYVYLTNLMKREEGQGMAEYGLILALVAVVVIAALSALGDGLINIFDQVVAEL